MISTAFAFVLLTATSPAPSFGPLENGAWADTPKGRFECWFETGGYLHLKLDGKLIYRGFGDEVVPAGPRPISEGFLASGTDGTGCFDVIDNHAGYLVIQRGIGPPWYGFHDIALIDFVASPPTITELVEGDPPPGKVHARVVVWKEDGFSLRYHGLPVGVGRDDADAPEPALHELWFDFASKKTTQVK
jgi:hypothetical protein